VVSFFVDHELIELMNVCLIIVFQANKLAEQLGIEFAPAITGFERRSGGTVHPIKQGIVIHRENVALISSAYEKLEETRIEGEKNERLQITLQRWAELTRKLLIKSHVERLFESTGNQTKVNVLTAGKQLQSINGHKAEHLDQSPKSCKTAKFSKKRIQVISCDDDFDCTTSSEDVDAPRVRRRRMTQPQYSPNACDSEPRGSDDSDSSHDGGGFVAP
jgi:hypothetical protein